MDIYAFIRRLFGAPSAVHQPTATDLELADAIHFDHFVIHAIRQLTQAPLQRMETDHAAVGSDAGAAVAACCTCALQFMAVNELAGPIIDSLKSALHGKGYTVFRSEQNFGHMPDVIAIIKSDDPFDILRCKGTEAANYGLDNESLISTLRSWQAETPFDIIGADYDWVEARFSRPPANWLAMAEKVYDFCPDVVDQEPAA